MFIAPKHFKNWAYFLLQVEIWEIFPDVLGPSEGAIFYQRTEIRKAESDTEILYYFKHNRMDNVQDTSPTYYTIPFPELFKAACIDLF